MIDVLKEVISMKKPLVAIDESKINATDSSRYFWDDPFLAGGNRATREQNRKITEYTVIYNIGRMLTNVIECNKLE